ncbi:MAG: hypothetical protein Q9224_004666, partial [Gallowayella concinna]
MVYSLAYRRPPHVPRRSSTVSGESEPSIGGSTLDDSRDVSISYGIPEALSFDRIIDGGTCPPCTTRDFMNYLIYIEHAAENLQFFLWHKDYLRRFDLLSDHERKLAPEWTVEQAEAQALASKDSPAPMKSISADAMALFKGTDFAVPKATVVELGKGASNPFGTPPMTPRSGDHD